MMPRTLEQLAAAQEAYAVNDALDYYNAATAAPEASAELPDLVVSNPAPRWGWVLLVLGAVVAVLVLVPEGRDGKAEARAAGAAEADRVLNRNQELLRRRAQLMERGPGGRFVKKG